MSTQNNRPIGLGKINLSKTDGLRMREVSGPITWQHGRGITGAIISLDMRQCMELARISSEIGRKDMPTEIERALIPFLAPFEEKFNNSGIGIWETFMSYEDLKNMAEQNAMENNMTL